MHKNVKDLRLSVSVLKEGKRYIAYSPALDLSTSGKSPKDVKRKFEEITKVFFDELIVSGNMEEVLRNLGWRRIHKEWNPPRVVENTSQKIRVPVAV